MARPSVPVTRRRPAAVKARPCERYDAVLNRFDVGLGEAELRDAMVRQDAVLPTMTDRIGAAAMVVPGARQVDDPESTLRQCGFVSLRGAANRHMIGAPGLNYMRPDAFPTNTARGEVIDESAPAQAFGTMGGAGLDVFEGEPRIGPDLAGRDNLVMLPHTGSATREAREAMGFRALDNLDDFFESRQPRDRVA